MNFKRLKFFIIWKKIVCKKENNLELIQTSALSLLYALEFFIQLS